MYILTSLLSFPLQKVSFLYLIFFLKFPSQKYNALCEVWLQLVDSSGSAEELSLIHI